MISLGYDQLEQEGYRNEPCCFNRSYPSLVISSWDEGGSRGPLGAAWKGRVVSRQGSLRRLLAVWGGRGVSERQ